MGNSTDFVVNFPELNDSNVVGPLLPNDLIGEVDKIIANYANTKDVHIEYIKAGHNSEYLYAFITTHD